MSFNATFKFTGGPAEGMQVISSLYGFGQPRDAVGRPSGTVQCSNIALRLIPAEDNELESWMLNDYEQRDGSIVYTRTDSLATFKELVFEKAYCRAYEGSFNATGKTKNTSLITEVYLTAKVVVTNGIRYENNW